MPSSFLVAATSRSARRRRPPPVVAASPPLDVVGRNTAWRCRSPAHRLTHAISSTAQAADHRPRCRCPSPSPLATVVPSSMVVGPPPFFLNADRYRCSIASPPPPSAMAAALPLPSPPPCSSPLHTGLPPLRPPCLAAMPPHATPRHRPLLCSLSTIIFPKMPPMAFYPSCWPSPFPLSAVHHAVAPSLHSLSNPPSLSPPLSALSILQTTMATTLEAAILPSSPRIHAGWFQASLLAKIHCRARSPPYPSQLPHLAASPLPLCPKVELHCWLSPHLRCRPPPSSLDLEPPSSFPNAAAAGSHLLPSTTAAVYHFPLCHAPHYLLSLVVLRN